MDVRKFEALSMQDAIKLVKKELGKDAVILSTREKSVQMDGARQPVRVIEVVAAPSAASRASAAPGVPAARTTQASPALQARAAGLYEQNQNLVAAQSAGQPRGHVLTPAQAAKAARVDFPRMQKESETTVVKGASQSMPSSGAANPQRAQGVPNPQNANGPTPTLGQLNAQTRRAAQALATGLGGGLGAAGWTGEAQDLARREVNEDVRELREELTRVRRELESIPHVNVNDQMQEIKILLHDMMRSKSRAENSQCHPFLADIGIKMRAGGVPEALIAELLGMVSGLTLPTNADGTQVGADRLREFFLNQTIRAIFKNLHVTGTWKSDGQQNLISLVGPTGVGKTTTIAKLAARMKLTEGARVALVSMDSFRIAAADQLRVYSKILDCPFTEAGDVRELEAFVQRHFDYDTIFIDTAGRSARHAAQMETLRALQSAAMPIQFNLCLSSTMKSRDIEENIKAFRFLSPESLIFTKLDESWSFGEILGATVSSRIPLSYFTTGQKVPEDIEPAAKERVVERIFRL